MKELTLVDTKIFSHEMNTKKELFFVIILLILFLAPSGLQTWLEIAITDYV